MSTAPLLSAHRRPPGDDEGSIFLDDKTPEQGDFGLDRRGAARGTAHAILLGAAIWAGCILAGIALVKR